MYACLGRYILEMQNFRTAVPVAGIFLIPAGKLWYFFTYGNAFVMHMPVNPRYIFPFWWCGVVW